MKTKLIEIGCVVGALLLLALAFGCKDEVEADEPIYSPIDNRALSTKEIAEIYWKLSEPSELDIQCSCGWKYKVTGYDLCYTRSWSMVMDIPDPLREDD